MTLSMQKEHITHSEDKASTLMGCMSTIYPFLLGSLVLIQYRDGEEDYHKEDE